MQYLPVLVSGLMIALAIPMILKKVPRNPLYGFRTPHTMSSDEVWYEANRIAGWDLLVAGAVTLAILGLQPLVPALAAKPPSFFILFVFVPAITIAIIHSFWRLRDL